jgi:hypothetical protein
VSYNKTINDFQFDGYQDLLTQEYVTKDVIQSEKDIIWSHVVITLSLIIIIIKWNTIKYHTIIKVLKCNRKSQNQRQNGYLTFLIWCRYFHKNGRVKLLLCALSTIWNLNDVVYGINIMHMINSVSRILDILCIMVKIRTWRYLQQSCPTSYMRGLLLYSNVKTLARSYHFTILRLEV